MNTTTDLTAFDAELAKFQLENPSLSTQEARLMLSARKPELLRPAKGPAEVRMAALQAERIEFAQQTLDAFLTEKQAAGLSFPQAMRLASVDLREFVRFLHAPR